MARETKEERTVKAMIEPLMEHLLDLKSLAANPNAKESDLERWCQSLLRSGLGYSAVNGYTIRAQESKGRSRPDLKIRISTQFSPIPKPSPEGLGLR